MKGCYQCVHRRTSDKGWATRLCILNHYMVAISCPSGLRCNLGVLELVQALPYFFF